MSTLMRERSTDESVEVLTRWLADRTPRRAFLGRIGRGLVASSVGGAAALSLFTERAYAGGCGCYGDVSVSCDCLPGGTNACPSGTCECGCWTTCTSMCTGCNNTQWCDCCNTSAGTPSCVQGCGPDPGRPKNCFNKEWSGGCGTVNQTQIRCRHWFCSTGSACC